MLDTNKTMKKIIIPIILTTLCMGNIYAENKETISITAEILEYSNDWQHVEYMDGSWSWDDAVILKIIEPKKWKDKKLFLICIDEPQNSIWRKTGNIYEFEIVEEYISESKHNEKLELTSGLGAVKENIKLISPPGLIINAKIIEIVNSPLSPPSRTNWVIKTKINKMLAGKFNNEYFDFRIHSPSRSGLKTGDTITFFAEWVEKENKYIVDEMQFIENKISNK